jgi:hypothetical protein
MKKTRGRKSRDMVPLLVKSNSFFGPNVSVPTPPPSQQINSCFSFCSRVVLATLKKASQEYDKPRLDKPVSGQKLMWLDCFFLNLITIFDTANLGFSISIFIRSAFSLICHRHLTKGTLVYQCIIYRLQNKLQSH